MKRFNVTGLCIPNRHYMVDTSEKLEKIKLLVDAGFYFTINRARQYGKTTMLNLLEQQLADKYIVVSLSFEGVGPEAFESAQSFCGMFMRKSQEALEFDPIHGAYAAKWVDKAVATFEGLGKHIASLCKNSKIILLIDEVDKASNNQVFLEFLGMLRERYLARERGKAFTYHSVVLAGVNDIKTIKLKLVGQGMYTISPGEGSHNSPWNIAVKFDVDMSFHPNEIATILLQYEGNHHIGMDIPLIAQEIYGYTSGYPFLVSRICQAIDEELDADWTLRGVQSAVKIILRETNTLFSDMIKNLENSHELYDFIYNIIIVGRHYDYNAYNPLISLGTVYGIVKATDRGVQIANTVFSVFLTNYFISKNDTGSAPTQDLDSLQHAIIQNGRFDMALCLTKFAEHYENIFHREDLAFLERHGRLLFLTYLKPLINGQGFYHIESQLTGLRRMDIVVDFMKDQFILELKIWHREVKHEQAYEQLSAYLDSRHAAVGYLVTFDFRKDKNRQPKAAWMEFFGKRIFDVIV
ncbi:AAA-like domain-containing protein [Lachnospiraceae bacterium ZAX-1]